MHPLFHSLFIKYCSYFNGNQDYFECHEVLEEYWKILSPKDKNHPLVGYIQLATGMYHWRRQNLNGAKRMLSKAFRNFQENKDSEFFEYVDFNYLCDRCSHSIEKVTNDCPFEPFQIEIVSTELKTVVEQQISEQPKDSYHFLLNKHMLRDRSDILTARELKRNSNRLL